MNVPRQRHIGQNGHTRKKFDILKSPADAHTDKFVRVKVCNVFSVEDDLALLGAVKTCYAVEQAGFSRSVGTDNRHQFAGMHLKINILNGDNATETQAQTLNFQFGFFIFFPPVDHDRRPAAKSFHSNLFKKRRYQNEVSDNALFHHDLPAEQFNFILTRHIEIGEWYIGSVFLHFNHSRGERSAMVVFCIGNGRHQTAEIFVSE